MTPHQSALPLVRLTLYLVFFASGAAALIYQVAWQRVLSFHAGMDLFSVTTVVAAFMAGLGIGNLLGGSIADRLTPRRAVLLYAVAELLISTFGWLSIWLLYTQYPTFSPYIRTTASAFLFHFVVLCVPTTLMGTTTPPAFSRGGPAELGDCTHRGKTLRSQYLGGGVRLHRDRRLVDPG
jgi:spermidine synthase